MPLFGTSWLGKPLPELAAHAKEAANWINSPPLTLEGLRGKPVLVDFWEYSCINCLRTLPYLRAWYERYHKFGLEIIGVHVPEFAFGKDTTNLRRAFKELGITWPVVLDNEYQTWKKYDNNVWPREFLLDPQGLVVHDQSGEGNYRETETLIQKLIRKAQPDAKLPALLEPVRSTDRPGSVCYRTTPELYAGYLRGSLGNPEGYTRDKIVTYADPKGELQEDLIYVAGSWKNNAEYMQRAGSPTEKTWLGLQYHAKGVYAVIKPETEAGFRVWIEQDGLPLRKEAAGEDINFEGERAYLLIDNARMYRIVNNPEFGVHTLKLRPESDSFGLYAFTFESACQT